MIIVLLSIAVLVGVVLLSLGARWLMLRAERGVAERSISDFMKVFPDRCPICAYHRFGLQMGLEANDAPLPPHHCIEALKGNS